MTDESTENSLGNDDRIIHESGIDARIASIIAPAVAGAGFRLVRVRLSGQNGLTLQIMAERPDGTMTVEDCEALSLAISPALDVDDPIEKNYHLEVSSPGIDRPLVRKSDFANWIGHLAKFETSVMVAERKRFRGRIAAADDNGITVDRDAPGYGEAPTVVIPYDALAEAHLILTDDLVRDALSKDNRAKKDARKRRKDGDTDDTGAAGE